MPSNKKTKKHQHKETATREANRMRLTILFLIREEFGLPTNPESLDDPQPLSELDVVSYLQAIVREHATAKCE